MILNFHVEVEVSDYQGEKYVDYIKHSLNLRGEWSGKTRVVYEPHLTKTEDYFETIEQDAINRGELEI